MKNERKFEGIWISKEIWLSGELTLQEKVFFVEIRSLDNEEGCFASNAYFAQFFGISEVRASTVINSLIKKGYIENIGFNGRKRILKVKAALKESLRQTKTKVKGSLKENFKHNNTYNNTSNTSSTKVEQATPELQIIPCDSSGNEIKQKKKAREDISYLLSEIKKIVGIVDGSNFEKRMYAKNFIDSKMPKMLKDRGISEPSKDLVIRSILKVFVTATQDDFHRKNATKIKYVYNNIGAIISSSKQELNKTNVVI